MERSKASRMGEALNRFLKNDPMGEMVLKARVFATWDEVMGSAGVKATLSREFNGGTLRITLSSSVLRMQMSTQTEQIRTQLNAALGGEVITKLYLK